MRLFATTPTARQIDLGLLSLRLVLGAVFIAHGAQKVFVYGFGGVSGAFGQMGVPMPGITGPLVALLEFLGGIALLVGLLTRLAAFGLAINMLGALFLVHLSAGFFLPQGYEFVLALFGALLALVLMGPGAYSIDHAVGGRRATAATVR